MGKGIIETLVASLLVTDGGSSLNPTPFSWGIISEEKMGNENFIEAVIVGYNKKDF